MTISSSETKKGAAIVRCPFLDDIRLMKNTLSSCAEGWICWILWFRDSMLRKVTRLRNHAALHQRRMDAAQKAAEDVMIIKASPGPMA